VFTSLVDEHTDRWFLLHRTAGGQNYWPFAATGERDVKRLCAVVAVLLAAVLSVFTAAAFLLLRGGTSAKLEPTRFESTIARKLRRLGIPASSRQLRNPAPHSDEVVAAGRAHFAYHCAICHANDGSGRTETGRNLYPRAPDLRLAETQQLTDGELYYIIENGVRLTGMPGWGAGSEDSKLASWHLVTFIRHLPQLTPEEKLEMERLNPKSAEEWRELQEDEEFLEGKDRSGGRAQQHQH
jgi:mono/diheme cytochrome c family protein